MPTYQYACTECDHAFEQFQSFSDDSLTVCPACEGRLRKVFNAVGVVFKGSGFYRTDSRTDAPSTADAASDPYTARPKLDVSGDASRPPTAESSSTPASPGRGTSDQSESSSTKSSSSSDSSGSPPRSRRRCRAPEPAGGCGQPPDADPRRLPSLGGCPDARPARRAWRRVRRAVAGPAASAGRPPRRAGRGGARARPHRAPARDRGGAHRGARHRARRRGARPGPASEAAYSPGPRARPGVPTLPQPSAVRRPARSGAVSRSPTSACSPSDLLAGYPGRVAAPVRVGDPGTARLLRVGDRVTLFAADPQGEAEPVEAARDVPVVALPATPGAASPAPAAPCSWWPSTRTPLACSRGWASRRSSRPSSFARLPARCTHRDRAGRGAVHENYGRLHELASRISCSAAT